jgi:Protein of unknown function (DUF2934)
LLGKSNDAAVAITLLLMVGEGMSGSDQDDEQAIRERAYFIWHDEGRPSGRAFDHWLLACAEERERQNERLHDEEKILAGRLDANMPALLTKDVQGG